VGFPVTLRQFFLTPVCPGFVRSNLAEIIWMVYGRGVLPFA